MAKKFVTPATYARIRQAAQAFILDGAGLVPNHNADFEEPIYKIAHECFGLDATLATVDRELEKHGLDADGSNPLGEAIIHAYDTTLIVGYMFGCAVGLQMAAGLAMPITVKKGGRR